MKTKLYSTFIAALIISWIIILLPVTSKAQTCIISDIQISNISPCNDNSTSNDTTDDWLTADVTVTFQNAPSTGNLQLHSPAMMSAGWWFAALVSSQYTFTGVIFRPDDISLYAEFTDAPGCISATINVGAPTQPCSYIPLSVIFPTDTTLGCNPTSSQLEDETGKQPQVSGGCLPRNISMFTHQATALGCVQTQVIDILVTDGCGNSSSDSHIVSWTFDPALPVFTFCPPTLNLACNPSQIPWGVATATDNCGTPDVTSSLGQVQVNGCSSRSQVLTFTATDACGNTRTCQQIANWNEDFDPPVFTNCLPGSDLGCNPVVPNINNTSFLSATDACASVLLIGSQDPIINTSTCGRSRTISWIAQDDCGNSSTCLRTWTWTEDATLPTLIGCPAGGDLGCNPVTPDCSNITGPTATDNCGTPTVTCSAGTITNTSTYGRSRNITWRADDGCGNYATCTKTFTWKESPPMSVDAGPNKIVYIGYPDSACARLQSTISGGAPPLTRVWSTAGNSNLGSGSFINVCPTATRVYYLTVTDANGCSQTDSVKVCALDVHCGNNNTNFLVCHGTGSASNPFVTLCVDLAGAKWHLKKHAGEKLGTCGMNKSCTFPIETRLDNSWEEVINENSVYLGAFPNPFTNSTAISFMLPENDFTNLKVIDITGRVIANLYEGKTEAGNIYDVIFDCNKCSNGIYFIVLNSRNGILQTRKLILDK